MKVVCIDEIYTQNNLYDIYRRELSPKFLANVKANGILSPIYLVESQQGLVIIDGFLRFAVAKSAGLRSIPAVILSSKLLAADLITLRVSFDCSKDRLPLMTQVRLVQLIDALLAEPLNYLMRKEMRQYLQINKDIYTKLQTLATAIPEIQDYYQKYNAPLANTSCLFRQSRACQKPLMDWAKDARVRPVELDKILLDIEACAKKQKLSFADFWQVLTAEVDQSNLVKGQQLQQLKAKLEKFRYPTLLKMRAQASQAAQAIKDNYGLDLNFDPSFESDKIKISFQINSLAKLAESLAVLDQDQVKELIEKVLK